MNLDATLTKREEEIAEPLAWGATYKEVAHRLGISKKTVDNHAQNIHRKTEVQSNGQLSAWYFCKYFGINPLLNPLLSIVFLLLISVNEISGQDLRPVGRVTVKTARARRKESDPL